MGCECAGLRDKGVTEKTVLAVDTDTHAEDSAQVPVSLNLIPIRRLTKPLSAFYQVQASNMSGLVQARCVKTGQTRALRILPKEKVVTEQMSKDLVTNRLVQISSLDHPNILRPFELLEDFRHFYFAYPALSALVPCLTQPSLPESLYAAILAQLLSALLYAHNHQCYHNTLDLDCLFLRTNSTPTSIGICLGGFENQLEGRRQPPSTYEAPETLLGKTGEKADVWSCGVIMYLLLSGKSPFHPIKYATIVARGKTMKVKKPESDVGEDAWDMLLSMLRWRPEQRPSLAQCLLHPWVRQAPASVPSIPCRDLKNMLLAMGNNKPRSVLREAIKYFILFRLEKIENLDQMTSLFRYFDSNADGQISESELLAGLRKWLPGSQALHKAQQVMAAAGTDSSGCIDYSDFLLSAVNEDSLLSKTNLLAVFSSLDRDHSGKLSIRELRDIFVLSASGDKEQAWLQLMREVDKNGDGEIDFPEFTRLMQGE